MGSFEVVKSCQSSNQGCKNRISGFAAGIEVPMPISRLPMPPKQKIPSRRRVGQKTEDWYRRAEKLQPYSRRFITFITVIIFMKVFQNYSESKIIPQAVKYPAAA